MRTIMDLAMIGMAFYISSSGKVSFWFTAIVVVVVYMQRKQEGK